MPKVACTGNYISGRSTVLRCKKPCPDQPLALHFASFIEFQEMLLSFIMNEELYIQKCVMIGKYKFFVAFIR